METKFTGKIDERGILQGIYRKGFTPTKCISELHANSIDAQATEIVYSVLKDSIKIIDNGTGMDHDNIIDGIFSIYKENHSNDKSMGVSGLGAKAALAILSNKTKVLLYTKKNLSDYICAEIPWDDMYRDGKYTGMIRIRHMTELEVSEYHFDRTNMNIKFQGTTIQFGFNEILAHTIRQQFIKNNEVDPENMLSVIYGRFTDVSVSYKHFEEVNARKLELYNYFKDTDNKYYKGKSRYDISFYQSTNKEELRFIWHNKDNKDYEIVRSRNGYSKDLKEISTSLVNYKHIGCAVINCAIKRNKEYFDDDNPKMPTAETITHPYDKRHIGENNSDYLCRVQLVRNNQVIGVFELPDVKISSARGNGELMNEIYYTRCEFTYNPISTTDNEQDLIIGIQENKNQYICSMPINLLRLIRHIRKHKSSEIWKYFTNSISQQTPEPVIPEPSPQPVIPEPSPQPVIPDPTPQPVIPDPSPLPVIPEPDDLISVLITVSTCLIVLKKLKHIFAHTNELNELINCMILCYQVDRYGENVNESIANILQFIDIDSKYNILCELIKQKYPNTSEYSKTFMLYGHEIMQCYTTLKSKQ
jgi:hypothetical protein